MASAYPALVLNADFTPMRLYPLPFWSQKRALKNISKGKAIIVEHYDAVIRSAYTSVRPASVVALKEYRKPRDQVPFTRLNLFLRDDFRCQYCGERHSPGNLTYDHVVPRASGGGTNWENIVAACVPCNTRKGCRTDIKPLTVPRRPKGEDMLRKQPPRQLEQINLDPSQIDVLYWSGALEMD